MCWMLQAWLPPPWPLLGALLAAIRLCTFSYWINSYWGGAVAALGGALVLGALARVRQVPSVRYGVLLAVGVVTLAHSRPFEGLVFCLVPAGCCGFWTLRSRGGEWQIWRRRVLMPVIAFLALAALASCYYFWRVTGDPFVMPHELNASMNARGRAFIWQPPYPPRKYAFPIMQALYERSLLRTSLRARGRAF
jgi:hypothetical protein